MKPNTMLDRALNNSTPIIDGNNAMFLWHGESAPYLIGDFNDWGRSPAGAAIMERLDNGLWGYCVSLPIDAYMEYIFTYNLDNESERYFDPLNPRSVANGFGKKNNYFRMPKSQATSYATYRKGVRQGVITRHSIYDTDLLVGDRRDVWLFHPPVDHPVPLLVILDGRDYIRHAGIAHIVTNLMYEGLIEPLALALVDNARDNRFVEYYNSESTLDVLTELVIPLASQYIHLQDLTEMPGAYAVMGASWAGQMALYAGLRKPNIFGKVAIQSGTFKLGSDTLLNQLVERNKPAPVNIWQGVGCYDPNLMVNQRVYHCLMDRGYDVSYHEVAAGQNLTAWRDTLPDLLQTLYGVGIVTHATA